MTSFPDIVETSAAELAVLLRSGELTVPGLVAACLERIRRMDGEGPRLHGVIETSDHAMSIADSLERELREGRDRGPLHGIPVMLKDNIATADGMENTAGSWALAGALPLHDAGLVPALRDVGAVILGKANLSEWSNIRSPRSQGGWSGRGGQARNPYSLDRGVYGSSSGSAVVVAASYVPLAVGTETDGSIAYPASVNGVVGLKPTVGLVSRRGVIPIVHHQDSPGPIARTVADAALLLTVLSSQPDQADLEAQRGPVDTGKPHLPPRPDEAAAGIDYLADLDPDSLQGARLGVLRSACMYDSAAATVFDRALLALTTAGATLIDPLEIPEYDWIAQNRAAQFGAYFTEAREGFVSYIEEFVAEDFPVRTMADVVEFNRAHSASEMAFFGQEFLEQIAEAPSSDQPEYAETMVSFQRAARTGLDRAFSEHRLDAIIAPTIGPAAVIDLVHGERYPGGASTISAIAGYPILTVNAGYFKGLPVGMSFTGLAWSEQRLLNLAHAFELRGPERRVPGYLDAIVKP